MYFLVCCLRDRMISVYVMNLNVLGEIINRDIIDKRKRKLRLFIEGKLILMKFFFSLLVFMMWSSWFLNNERTFVFRRFYENIWIKHYTVWYINIIPFFFSLLFFSFNYIYPFDKLTQSITTYMCLSNYHNIIKTCKIYIVQHHFK